MDEEIINNIFDVLTTAYFAFSIITISIVGIKILIDSIKDKMNMENQEQNKNLLNRRISKWRKRSFESKVNIIILSIALISYLISLGGFWYYCSYSYRDNGFYNQWLIASFISALFIGIWYYLNYQRFTIEQCKKYGVIFIVAGFLSLISPFIALALLIEGTIMLKNVYGKNTENQTDVLATDNKYEYVINSGLDVLDGFKHLTSDSRIIAAFLCGSIIWEKGGSREHPSYNWHVFRTLLINFDLWKKYDDIKKVDEKAEQLLSLFLKRNDNPNIVYQCIYEHKIDEDITTFESIGENVLVPKEFDSVLSTCKENLLKAVETINDLESIGVIYDAEDESFKAADNFFYAQKEKIKKIAILAGLRMAEFKEDWVDMSLEELIYTADLVKDIGLEGGVRHLVIPRLQDITDLELHKKYQQYEADKRRLFLHKHADMIHKSKFKDNQYQLFPMKGMCAWYLWCGDENITGSKESLLQQAESGNYEAYNNLATKCEDEEEILKYFHLAADHGSSNAQQNLWVQYYVKKNYEEAMKWMKKAADGGNLYALTNLARSCYWGINIEKDLKTACSCFKQIAQMNWNAPEFASMNVYNKSLIISGNISYWLVKKECEEQHIDIFDAQTDSQPKMSKIEEVWNFLDFAKKMGQPKRAALTNNETGEKYAALMFPTPQGDREFTMVAFSSDLGELTAKEIVDRKDELYVVKLESGNYYLRDNKSLQVDNCDINSLQLWIDGSLKDLQSVYLKDTLTSEQQLQAVIYLVSLLCYKPNAPTEQIIKYVSTKYSIPENILSQYIKDYRYYRTLLAEDILGYTSMVVCKLCIYKPETSLEQIVVLGKDNNLQKILNRFPQHKVTTNNIAICSEHDINNDTIPNNGTFITRSLSIYLDEFEQITIGLAYSMEILK